MIYDKTPRFGIFTTLLPYLKGNETQEEVEKIIDTYIETGLLRIQKRSQND